jgi:hypothetical protein
MIRYKEFIKEHTEAELQAIEDLLIEAYASDDDMNKSLHSLMKNNNGLFKSEAQGHFVKSRANSLHGDPNQDGNWGDKAKDHYKGLGIPIDLNKHSHMLHTTVHMDMGGWSAQGYRAGRGARTSHKVFLMDKHGVHSAYKLGESGHQLDPKKTQKIWERPAGVEVKHEHETEAGHAPVMVSQHQGKVGEKHTFTAKLERMHNLGPAPFGPRGGPDQHMSVFKTKDGHLLHHFGTPPKEVMDHHLKNTHPASASPEHKEFKITATVKKHHIDRNGNNVTVVTRPKIEKGLKENTEVNEVDYLERGERVAGTSHTAGYFANKNTPRNKAKEDRLEKIKQSRRAAEVLAAKASPNNK